MIFYKNVNDLSEKIMKISKDEKLKKNSKSWKDEVFKIF